MGGALSEKVMVLTESNWQDEVIQSFQAVLIDFWAPWCAPCRLLAPVVDAVAAETSGRLKVGKVNVDEAAALAERYGVRSIPTLILFMRGEAVARHVGSLGREQLLQFVDGAIAAPAERQETGA
jgi:thioredoxin 1